MSYVGGGYEYDLFISYSHGTASTDQRKQRQATTLRDWSRRIADELADSLSIRFNPEDEDRPLTYFVDDREFDSGEYIRDTLIEKAKKSAIILVLMSPYFPRSEICRLEVSSFLAQATKDGRGRQHCVLREIQKTDEEDWPPELRDTEGGVVNRGDPFFDPGTKLPLHIEDFRLGGAMPLLAAPLRRLYIHVAEKLEGLRSHIDNRDRKVVIEQEQERIAAIAEELRRQPPPPAEPATATAEPPAELPVAQRAAARKSQIYLQSEPGNADAWRQVRATLNPLAIVNPEELVPDKGDASLLSTYDERRRKMLRFCHGFVLLRARADDDINFQIQSANFDLGAIEQEWRRNIPWALIDQVEGDGSDISVSIPRIPASLPDWPARLFKTLGLSQPAAG